MKTHSHAVTNRLPKRFDELVRLHTPRAIHDETEYEATQAIIDRLTSVANLTKDQSEYLDTLAVLLEAYEREHHAIETADLSGIDALEYLLEENGMTASDLGRLLGDRALGTRILRGERQLSKEHIRRLCKRFQVSADLFIRRDPAAVVPSPIELRGHHVVAEAVDREGDRFPLSLTFDGGQDDVGGGDLEAHT